MCASFISYGIFLFVNIKKDFDLKIGRSPSILSTEEEVEEEEEQTNKERAQVEGDIDKVKALP